MAADEDTKTKAKTGEEGAAKGGGLKSLILVAVGAILGGAGAVFLVPPPEPAKVETPRAPEIKILHHPDAMEFLFNPPVERGTKTATVAFEFDYKVVEGKEVAALDSMKKHWARAFSRCLVVLSATPAKELATDMGKARLRKRLIEELTFTLFPQGDAVVEDVLWTKFFLQ